MVIKRTFLKGHKRLGDIAKNKIASLETTPANKVKKYYGTTNVLRDTPTLYKAGYNSSGFESHTTKRIRPFDEEIHPWKY